MASFSKVCVLMQICYIYLLCVRLSFCATERAEYGIKQQISSVSYLRIEIPQVSEQIFPQQLSVNLSITNYVGLLLYSIDANKNELILTMSGIDMKLQVNVLGGKVWKNSLRQMCRCKVCLYKPLLLKMGMKKSKFWIQCNDGMEFAVPFNLNNRTVMKGYLLLTPKRKKSSSNSADLYLVNIPDGENQQMTGCIFAIEYNGQPISKNMSIVGQAITKGCHQSCSTNKCNGGLCRDTYGSEPICDCSIAFGNGQYCNDENQLVNKQFNYTFQKFVGIKLSWRSNEKIFWRIGNNQSALVLTTDDSSKLVLTRQDFQRKSLDEKILLTEYIRNQSYVLILRSGETNSTKKQENVTLIYANYDPLTETDENYNSMIASSCDGVIDMAVLLEEHDLEWKPIRMPDEYSSNISCDAAEKPNSSDSGFVGYIGIIAIFIVPVIILIGLWMIGVYILRWFRGRLYHVVKYEVPPNGYDIQSDSLVKVVIGSDFSDKPTMWISNSTSENIDKAQRNRLFDAVIHGQSDVIQDLIDTGVDVNCTNGRDSRTPLHLGSQHGHLDVVKILISNGANISVSAGIHGMPLHRASENGHLEVVEHLIANKANVNAVDARKRTPLHLASKNGHLDVVKSLILNSVYVNTSDNDGWTSLHYASAGGHLSVVEYLILKEANVYLSAQFSGTALHRAAENGHVAVVRYLIEKGRSAVDAEDDLDGRTPLHLAVRKGLSNVVDCLISFGADVNKQDWGGWISLHHAAEVGVLDIVSLLVSKGANILKASKIKGMPIHRASDNGHLAVVQDLIARGASSNSVDDNNRTPLHLAARKGYLPVVECLMSHNADVKTLDKENCTALHRAAENGHLKIVEYLIGNGADVNAANKFNQTPLHLAYKNSHSDVVEYLRSLSEMNDVA